jgi:hypothetical protein
VIFQAEFPRNVEHAERRVSTEMPKAAAVMRGFFSRK